MWVTRRYYITRIYPSRRIGEITIAIFSNDDPDEPFIREKRRGREFTGDSNRIRTNLARQFTVSITLRVNSITNT